MFKNLDAYKLKWIAIIGMVLSHMVYAWQDIMPLWLMIPLMATGGLTYPIMGYFVIEGYKHTSDVKKYLLRLFVFWCYCHSVLPACVRHFPIEYHV